MFLGQGIGQPYHNPLDVAVVTWGRRTTLLDVCLYALALNYISMNQLRIVRLRMRASHIVCACVTIVLGIVAHSIISGNAYDDVEDDAPDDEDHYDCLGYESDFEEFLDEFCDQIRDYLSIFMFMFL